MNPGSQKENKYLDLHVNDCAPIVATRSHKSPFLKFIGFFYSDASNLFTNLFIYLLRKLFELHFKIFSKLTLAT